MQDRINQMRDEMEEAISLSSDCLHDSTEWWDSYYSDSYGGKRPIESLLDDLEAIATKYSTDLSVRLLNRATK